jgi:hypothetical protein
MRKLTKDQEETAKWARDFLTRLFKKQKRPTIYCVLKHVSTSGMSREISLLAISDNQLVNLDLAACSLMGWHCGKHDGIKVPGCGMDMGFHLVNNLSIALYCPKKYDHDSAFRLHSEWV